MLRSMYSGISGLKNFQTKLDVIGNNIANVNTFGFKKGRVTFKEMISQNLAGASAPSTTIGGINPRQVGLGSQVAAIDTIHTSGNLQSTGRVLDLAISGEGYFVVGNITGPTGTADTISNQVYTRAGNFYLDNAGFLVTSDGLYVAGSNGATQGESTISSSRAIKIPTDAKDMTVSSDGTVSYIDASGILQEAGKIVMAKFSNTSGLEKSGNNVYKETNNSGTALFDYASESGLGQIGASMLEMSNVDLSEEFTEMIVAQRGFQANTRIITTSDEVLQELVNLKR